MTEFSPDLEEETVRSEINRRKARRVLIQLPEGLRSKVYKIKGLVEEAGAEAFISASPCYGACDPYPLETGELGIDLVIHYGHSRLLGDRSMDSIYVEARSDNPVKEVVEAALPLLQKFSKVGLVTTIQHLNRLAEARNALAVSGKKVLIGDVGGLMHPGQVIGCDCNNAKVVSDGVEAFLVVAGGRFHALGVALATMKPTIVADPFEGRAYSLEEDVHSIMKKRWALIEEATRAGKIGVLIGLREGQRRLNLALQMKEKFEKAGKQAILLAVQEISPVILDQFCEVEAFVNTACPRVSLDDAARFEKPVLSLTEALIVLGEKSWEELCEEGWSEDLNWRRS